MAKFWPSQLCIAMSISENMTRIIQVLAIIATLIVISLSLQPSLPSGSVPNADKIMHLLAYAVLAALTRLGWRRIWGGWIVIGFIGLGVGLEIGQHLMALGRTASFADAIANSVGAVLAVTLYHIYHRRKRS